MAAIYLIRHAQASWGLGNYDQLSEHGEHQASILGDALAARLGTVDHVVTGQMERHRQTAAIALRRMGLDRNPVDEDARWNEYDHEEVIVRHKPAYKSKTRMVADLALKKDAKRAFQLMFDEALLRWVGGLHDDYVEPWPVFMQRAQDAVEGIAARIERSETALVFTSGGAISSIVAHLMGVDADGFLRINRVVANASVTKIVSGRSGLSLVSFNEHSWFEGVEDGLLTYR